MKKVSKKISLNTDNVIISTGSIPVELPGIKFDEKIILSSSGALDLKNVPKKMVIVGGGCIGLEMGSVWSRLGAEVHVIEALNHITPGMDREISSEFLKILKKQGIIFHLETKVQNIKNEKNSAKILIQDKTGKNTQPLHLTKFLSSFVKTNSLKTFSFGLIDISSTSLVNQFTELAKRSSFFAEKINLLLAKSVSPEINNFDNLYSPLSSFFGVFFIAHQRINPFHFGDVIFVHSNKVFARNSCRFNK